MTTMRTFALASACFLALGLAACGERRHASDDTVTAAPMSETVSDVPASSEEPAAAKTVPTSDASVRAPVSGVTPPQAQQDLNDDEVAAAGDTRRRPTPTPSDTPQ